MKKLFIYLLFSFAFVSVSVAQNNDKIKSNCILKENLIEIPTNNPSRFEITTLPYFEGFENFANWSNWTIYNTSDTANGTFVNLVTNFSGTNFVYEGNNSACFSSYNQSTLYDQYLASSNINLGVNTNKLKLSFYYRKYIYGEVEFFNIGYCLDDVFSLENCIWSDTIAAKNEEFKRYDILLPPNTKSFVIHYLSQYSYYLFVDAITLDYDDSLPCEAPTNLVATKNINTNYVDLKWDAISGALKYQIFRNDINGPIATVSDNKYTDTLPLTIGLVTCYSVVSVCSEEPINTSESSNESCVVVSSVNKLEKHVEVYPNPVKDKLFVNYSNVKNVSLFNILGQNADVEVYTDGSKTEINTNKLENGIYILKINTNNGTTLTKRIVVAK